MALPSLTSSKYELTVPSTQAQVEYRPYLVKEEKILMIASESKDENQMIRAIKDIIKSCTFGSCNVESMTMFDLEYVFTLLRSKSVGEGTELKLTCTSCDEPNEVMVDLNTIAVSEGPDNNIKITDTIGMTMKYPKINDVATGDAERSDIDKAFDIIVSCVESIYEGDELYAAEDVSKAELMTFIEELNSEQFQRINDFVSNMPYAYIDAKFRCNKCGEQNEINIRGLANFFK